MRALTENQLRAKGLKVETGTQDLESFPDPGFDFNPGKVFWQPDLSKFQQDIAESFRRMIPGLLGEMPVKTWDDLNAVMERFAQDFPGYFARGFEGIRVVKGNYFMATFTDRGLINISKTEIEPGYVPARDILRAFQKISNGEKLTFNEEHAIESLWHEIMHNTSKRPTKIDRQDVNGKMMEVLNQFIARHTYDQMISILGGQAQYKEAILERGYGYGDWITNFRTLLRYLGISEEDALPHLKEIHHETAWNRQWIEIAEVLAQISSRNISADRLKNIFYTISSSPGDFEEAIRYLFTKL